VHFLQLVANQVAAAVENSMAFQEIEALFAVSDAIASHRDRETLFRELADRLGKVMRFEVLSLVIYDPAANIMRRHTLEGTQPFPPPSELVFDLADDPARFVWESQQPLIVSNLALLARWPKYVEFVDRYGYRAFAFLPLTTARRRLGALLFVSRQAGAYDDVDVQFLQLVANQVAAAVENSMAFQEIEALFAVSEAIASHRERDALFHTLATRLTQVVRFEVLSLALYDPATKIMRRHVTEATSQFPVPSTSEINFNPADDPAWLAWETQKPYIAANLNQLERWPKYRELAHRYGAVCFCYLPLTTHRGRLGVLVFGSMRPGTYDDANVHFLQLVANQVAVAVENTLAFQEIETLKDKLVKEKAYLEEEVRSEADFGDIIGENPALRYVLKNVAIVSPTDSTVLVCGETGTGKELIARAVHDLSPRKARTFVKLNCAAIPTGLLESELFGHEKGAFTGAIGQKVGRFELAHQGTLFLDEIGDIPLELQPKLLRVLQEQEFERLGGTKTIRVNVRLVAATNRDLGQMVAENRFRGDLYYRLNVFPIALPALRHRADDVPRLVRHFTQLFSRRMGRRIETIPSEVMDALVSYPWPGNVRELQNVIERAVILSGGSSLQVNLADLQTAPAPAKAPGTGVSVTLADAEREHIVSALRDANWVLGGPKGAAARLGMKRSTLHSTMQRLGISRPE